MSEPQFFVHSISLTSIKTHLLSRNLAYETIPLQVEGVDLNLLTLYELISTPSILFLHGFGSYKEYLADLPTTPQAVAIPQATSFSPRKFHSSSPKPFLPLNGRSERTPSLAQRYPDRVLSFVDIKGNLTPEDCFLSRQIFNFLLDDPETFLDEFIDRLASQNPTTIPCVHPHCICRSARSYWHILGLLFLRMFMFGEKCRGLLHLPRLEKEGVELADIPHSGHFPVYSNPVKMYRRKAE
ncbi:alpha/beta-hydrolase [Penicillium atrosanguineum]|nr:alpha/beta-hydrolase [Penicillium atrosanguineum]